MTGKALRNRTELGGGTAMKRHGPVGRAFAREGTKGVFHASTMVRQTSASHLSPFLLPRIRPARSHGGRQQGASRDSKRLSPCTKALHEEGGRWRGSPWGTDEGRDCPFGRERCLKSGVKGGGRRPATRGPSPAPWPHRRTVSRGRTPRNAVPDPRPAASRGEAETCSPSRVRGDSWRRG